MSVTTSQEKNTRKNGWDQAISDAKARIRRLKHTIEVYRKRKKAGEPWPELEKTA